MGFVSFSGKQKKDNRTYCNFKYWTTKKLEEVIEEPYHRGVDGHEYEDHIDEIKNIYFQRKNMEYCKLLDKAIEEYNER